MFDLNLLGYISNFEYFTLCTSCASLLSLSFISSCTIFCNNWLLNILVRLRLCTLLKKHR